MTTTEIIRKAVKRKAIYQVQYQDYGSDTWTMPCILTSERADYVINDSSIRRIRIEFEL